MYILPLLCAPRRVHGGTLGFRYNEGSLLKVLVSIFGVAASTGLVAAYTPQGNAGTRAVFASTNIPSLSERPTGVSSREVCPKKPRETRGWDYSPCAFISLGAFFSTCVITQPRAL